MRTFNYLATLFAAGFAAQAVAEELTANATMPHFYYSATPEGKTLPAGVARIRLPYQTVTGSTTYDKDGSKSDSILKYSATGGAFVFEYGLSDKLSLQWKTDYYMNQSTSINTSSDAYGTTKAGLYSSKTSALAKATSTTITDQASLTAAVRTAFIGGCVKGGGGDATACATAYENETLKSTSATALGLSSAFGAGSASVSAKAYATGAAAAVESSISSGIKDAAESEGGRGLGDTIAGVLYEAYNTDTVFLSVGGGIRLPTGKRNLSGTELPTTRAAYELGVRLNLDYLPIDWFMFSWQNQSEGGIASTKREVNGVSQTLSRNGIRNVGFVYLKPSLAPLSPALDSIKTNFGVSYDYDSSQKISANDVEVSTDRTMANWLYAGLGYSFLNLGVPAQLDLEYEQPMSSKNVTVAVTKITTTLKAYAKF